MSEKKVALVTGASKGIGAACALELSSAGYDVALHYRSNADEAISIANESYGHINTFCYDLSEAESCLALTKDVYSKYGKIDVLVNNAGVSYDQMITFAKPEDFTKTLNTNLRAVFLLSKYASRYMIKRKTGCIINITSVVGHTGNQGQAAYTASKGAVTALSKSMALDLASFGIRCNCVAPGFIATNMTKNLSFDLQKSIIKRIPLQRMGSSYDVANAVVFLASDKASYITGTTLHINGGMFTS